MLTPDSKSYQEIALRVAVNDVLFGFENLHATTLPVTLQKLAPTVEALRIAREDLTFAPFELRLAVTSFVSAFEFALNTHPSVPLDDYLAKARQRLNAAVAAPDAALVGSQEATLRATVTHFITSWQTLKDTAAPARKTRPQDFPHLSPLPANRLQAGWVQSRQASSAWKSLKQADKALHLVYGQLTFAPVHLRLALSHFLMSWDLLKEYDDAGLDRARKSLQKAFDPSTPPVRSVYREPSLGI